MAESRAIFALARWKRDIRPFVAQRAAYRCEKCGKYCPLNRGGQADHRIPRRDCAAQGISVWDISNIDWLCAGCHSKKTNAEARWHGHIKTDDRVPGRGVSSGSGGHRHFPARVWLLTPTQNRRNHR